MKKIVSILLVVAMILCMSACGGSKEAAAPAATAPATASTTTQTAPAPAAEKEEAPNYVEFLCSITANESQPHGKAMQLFADRLEELTDGQVTVDVNYGATLYSSADEKVAIEAGDIDICYGNASWLATNSPWIGMLAAGYTYKNYDHMHAVLAGEIGDKVFKRVAEERNIVILGAMYQGSRVISLCDDKAIIVPSDLKGINLRMPESAVYVNLGKAMGVNATPMALSELYLALQTHAVDGQENPLSTINAQKFYEVQDSVSLTNHVVDSAWIALNGDSWNKLTDAQKELAYQAASEAVALCDETVLNEESELVDTFKGYGLSVYESDADAFLSQVVSYYKDNGIAAEWDADIYQAIQDLAANY